jgi:hypothetical protein
MKVYILEKYSPEDDMVIMNVFSTRELAQAWLDDYIREEYNIENEFTGNLQAEVYPDEFTINSYLVI